jgi:hypothetical protein
MRTSNKSSGIKGVTLRKLNGGKNKYWCARVQGRINIHKNFPFTKRGLELAAEFYNKSIQENEEKYYQYTKHGKTIQRRNFK